MTVQTPTPTPSPAASEFDALLAEVNTMDTLAKAMAEPEPEPEGEESDTSVIQENADEAEANAANKDGRPAMLGKSMQVQADGEEFEAFDAEELVKALDTLGTTQTTHGRQLEVLVKGMTAAVGTIKAMGAKLQEQGALIKALGDQGRGRRTAVTLHERPNPGGRSAAVPPDRETILSKSMDALIAKKISAADVSAIEATLNKGGSLDPTVLAALGIDH
jgi:hypothetical protein